eukprot:CAMPEP_0180267296 /NCGR_PEP_ID=MMETSP0988-20121125/1477_1 /TAXON_ID=697907 /ORGANISM="non described non described, Strain CCMP2293" /LENGTH=66 /DNA_ID=CAMNT_0022237973 /DNA_START=219 /DNA_END=417 /DNA_ORIENTATION=-
MPDAPGDSSMTERIPAMDDRRTPPLFPRTGDILALNPGSLLKYASRGALAANVAAQLAPGAEVAAQ